MKKIQFSTVILISLTLGLLMVFIVPANAVQISIQFGTLPPPPPPLLRYSAPPEPVYVEFDSNVVLELGSVYFSLDYPVVYGYYRDYGLTPDELMYILYLSHYCHRPPLYIINMYRDRHDWGYVIGHIGLPRSAPRWLRNRNAYLLAPIYATSAYYRVPYAQVYQIHQRGYRSSEIVAAVNVSGRSGRPVGDILVDRNKGKRWEDIAKENKTSFDDIKLPRGQGKSVKFGAPLTAPGLKPPGVIKSTQGLKAPDVGKGPTVKAPEANKEPVLKAPEVNKRPAIKAPEANKRPALKTPEANKGPAIKAPEANKGPALKGPEPNKGPAVKAHEANPVLKGPTEGKGPALKGQDADKGSVKEKGKGQDKDKEKDKEKENN
jgi:hypothetical protein